MALLGHGIMSKTYDGTLLESSIEVKKDVMTIPICYYFNEL